jgi:hypothetical protein
LKANKKGSKTMNRITLETEITKLKENRIYMLDFLIQLRSSESKLLLYEKLALIDNNLIDALLKLNELIVEETGKGCIK